MIKPWDRKREMLRGTLDDFSLPEVLRMLASSKKSGTLHVSRRAGSGRVVFRDGDVIYAETELSNSRLGEKLVQMGKISPVQLRKSLDVQATTGDRLGRILLVSEATTKDDLQEAVRSQIEDAAYELMCWEVGDFSWEPGIPEETDIDMSLNVEDLIMNVSSRLEQRDRMQLQIQSPAAVPKLVAHPPEGPGEINITPAQWRVLVLVDGTKTVGAIADAAGLSDVDAVKTLHALVAAGLVEVDDALEAAAEAPAPPSVLAEDADTLDPGPPAAEAVPEEWFEDPAEAGPANDLPLAIEKDVAEPPAAPPPRPAEKPAPPPRTEDLPPVDRAAAVRELAGLFDDPRSLKPTARRLDPSVEEPPAVS
jgi:Domain of unknown function (DUF4388)/MarR family